MIWNTDGLNLPDTEMSKVGRIDIIGSNGNDGEHYEQQEEKCKVYLTDEMIGDIVENYMKVNLARIKNIPKIPKPPREVLDEDGRIIEEQRVAHAKHASLLRGYRKKVKDLEANVRHGALLLTMQLKNYSDLEMLKVSLPGVYRFLSPHFRKEVDVSYITDEEIESVLGWGVSPVEDTPGNPAVPEHPGKEVGGRV